MLLDFNFTLDTNASSFKKFEGDEARRDYLKIRYKDSYDFVFGLGLESFDIWNWAKIVNLPPIETKEKYNYILVYYRIIDSYINYAKQYSRLHNGKMNDVKPFEEYWNEYMLRRKVISGRIA